MNRGLHRSLADLDAIIFDFDGVIIESTEVKTAAFLELFAHLPEHLDSIRRYHLDNLGLSRFAKFRWIYADLLKQDLSADESEELGRRFSRLVLKRAKRCPLVRGTDTLLPHLRDELLTFVVSGTPQEELDHIVEARKMRPWFTEVWGSPETKSRLVRSILSRFSLPAGRVLMVGDGRSDYRAATECDILFVARESPGSSQSWDEVNVPRVDDLHGLARLLETRHTS